MKKDFASIIVALLFNTALHAATTNNTTKSNSTATHIQHNQAQNLHIYQPQRTAQAAPPRHVWTKEKRKQMERKKADLETWIKENEAGRASFGHGDLPALQRELVEVNIEFVKAGAAGGKLPAMEKELATYD